MALAAEGIEFEVALCDDRFDYGRHLARLWAQGTGFIIVEWDIAPWPGALKCLWDCPEPHCHYLYPADAWMVGSYAGSLGCVKFSAELTRAHPDVPQKHRWPEISWEGLDGSVCLPVRERAGGIHEHGPPVAHVRRPKPQYRVELDREALAMSRVVCTQFNDGVLSDQREVAPLSYDDTVQAILERKATSAGSRGWQVTWGSNGFDAVKVYPGYTPYMRRREFRIV